MPTQSLPSRDLALSTSEFNAIARLVHARTGIVLGANKRELVYGRLRRRLRQLGCASFADYLERLNGVDGNDEHAGLINAITTNLTGFFREAHHFELLGKHVIPQLVRNATGNRLRIWSAGCSSGEEPYSIAMTLRQALSDVDAWDARILATDIDTNMIETCRTGVYTPPGTLSIPADLRRRFTVHSRTDGAVEMAPALKQLIRFRPLNLLQPWPMRGMFDVIFCRNVVIYFDKPTQRTLFDRLADILRPGGLLFIGHSESLFRVSERFRHLGRTAYRKIG